MTVEVKTTQKQSIDISIENRQQEIDIVNVSAQNIEITDQSGSQDVGVTNSAEQTVELEQDIVIVPIYKSMPTVTESDNGKVLTVEEGRWVASEIKTDETLSNENGVLSVNRAHEPEPDNTLPITAAAVAITVGNIEILLQTI